jgi:hypothetical protein
VPRTEIKYDAYKVKAFLDANIILEGRMLGDLPWNEIDADGPIIALMTPTAMKEVDSKKQDGRIGKRARAFNRLIGPVAAGGPPIVIRESGPRVELALSRAMRIPWDQHGDLDPDDGDSCIVAEALHARDMNDNGKMIVSHDIKPINFAANYDIETLHVSDAWLHQAEPSPAEKEVQRLKGKLAEYEAKEPEFKIAIEMLDGESVSIALIEDLTDAERDRIERKIVTDHPEQDQVSGPYGLAFSIGNYDHSYGDRYKAYRKRIPVFMETYEQRLERLFNQTPVRVAVVNTGKIQAENLLIEVTVSSGWLHDRYVWVSPGGPGAPKPRNGLFLNRFPDFTRSMGPPRVGRHEFAFKDEPECRSSFSVTCEDFRHGQTWSYDAIVGIDPRALDTTVSVVVTASNFRGKVGVQKQIARKLETVHVSRLIDLNSLKITAPTPIDGFLQSGKFDDMIDGKAFALDEDDDD